MNKLFIFNYNHKKTLYINAHESASPNLVIKIYTDWYNNDCAIEYNFPKLNPDKFEFIKVVDVLDFYQDSLKAIKEFKKNG